MKIFKEFKEFISRGNVVDMAVGVIVAGAFGKITTSLVNDVVMPFINWLFGAQDMSALDLVLREPVVDEATQEVISEGITLGFGTLLATTVDFLLIALVVFLLVKVINTIRKLAERKKAEEVAAPAEPPAPSKEEVLLTEIRDLLKNK